jgi:hypothetical protein
MTGVTADDAGAATRPSLPSSPPQAAASIPSANTPASSFVV